MTPDTTQPRSVIGRLGWSALERLAVQGVQLVVFILMARVLSPVDYGLVAMLAFFIILSQLIAEGGLSQAIIRKINRTEADCSTTFYVNILAGVALYAILAAAAPAIAMFYEQPRLTGLLRVMGLAVIIQSTLVVHRALLTARLDFKTQAKSTLAGAICSGAVGVWMAYHGFGPWALVGLQITNQAITAAVLWWISDWRPRLIFSRRSFRHLFGFGSKLLMSNIVLSLYNSFYSLMIGKFYPAYALGSYANASQISSFTSENLTRIVQRAAFPMFCSIRSDREKLRRMIREYLRLAMLALAPLLLGLMALSTPLTLGLMGHQWQYTAKLLAILCVAGLFYPLNAINFMTLEILGHGKLYLKLQIVNTLIGCGFLLATLRYGIGEVCAGLCVSSALNFIINSIIAGRSISLGLWQQFRAIFPLLLCAMVMAATIVGVISLFDFSYLVEIIIGIATGVVVYSTLIFIFQRQLCTTFFNILRGHSKVNLSGR